MISDMSLITNFTLSTGLKTLVGQLRIIKETNIFQMKRYFFKRRQHEKIL